jgi:DNA repair exonuclease SbcCD ATPase subunit
MSENIPKRVSAEAVNQAARSLAAKGEMPTIAKIRVCLGDRGSESTLHHYLSLWKKSLLKKAGEVLERDAESDPLNMSLVLQEQAVLRETLARQNQKTEALSAELFSAEREIARLKESNAEQQQQLEDQQQIYQNLKNDYEQIKAVYEGMCLERDRAVKVVIEDKNRLLELLREELKATHQENLKRVRELSTQDHDLLMQEKVRALNYEEKIKSLTEELTKLSSQYEKIRSLVEPLQQRIAQQSKMIEDHLSFEQLAAYQSLKEK